MDDGIVAVWAPSLIAAIIAVVVPWMTFRLALRQDQSRGLREQRARLYVDLLTEAYAERQYLDYDIADDETREHMRAYYVDLRLPPLERARLGARGSIFASRTVNKLFNQLQVEASRSTLPTRPQNEGERSAARVRVGRAFDELEAAIRQELGTDFTNIGN